MEPETAVRLQILEKEAHLSNHRLTTLEREELPRRVASIEPVVNRLEEKMDEISDHLETGLQGVKTAIVEQRSLQKGVVWAVAVVVGIIQLLPFIKSILT
jgi:hypothetical protein